MNEFVKYDNWYDPMFKARQDCRWPTFKAALNILEQRNIAPFTIVETGCQRLPDDWGAGCSSTLFCEFLSRYGGHLFTVDIDPNNCKVCEDVTAAWKDFRSVHCSDSVKFLEDWADKIDLLYLDSWDYPYGELLDIYGGRTDINEAAKTLNAMGEDTIVRLHWDLIRPAQEHCLKELEVSIDLLHQTSVILIDDNNLPGGGKSRLAKIRLTELGWTCVLDNQQTLWVKF